MLCYEELKERVESGKAISDDATAKDLTADGRWRWNSFAEWFKHSWTPRVLAQGTGVKEDAEGGATPQPQRSRQKKGMRTVVGAGRR